MRKRRLKVGSLFTGIGGFDLGFERGGMQIAWQVEIEKFCQSVLRSRFPGCPMLISSVEECRARMSRSRAKEPGLPENALDCFTSMRASLKKFDPLGLSLKMFPDFSVQTKEETLQKYSAFLWSNAGMGFAGVCSTANFSESPNRAAVCSLWDVLESHVHPRYFLSPTAARGVLRRAEKRARTLPSLLQAALEFVAALQVEEWKTILTMGTDRIEETEILLPYTAKLDTPLDGAKETELSTAEKPSVPTTLLLEHSTAPAMTEDSEQNLVSILSAILKPVGDGGKRVSELSRRLISKGIAILLLVRRLTPTECERLQGFPLGWTVPATEHLATRSQSKLRTGLRKGSHG